MLLPVRVIRGAVRTGGRSGQLHPGLWPWPHVSDGAGPRAMSKHTVAATAMPGAPSQPRQVAREEDATQEEAEVTWCREGTGPEAGMRGPKLTPQESPLRGSDLPGARGPTSQPLDEAVVTQVEPAPLGRKCGGST